MKDSHTIMIDADSICDEVLPIFDIDDGFLPNVFASPKILIDEFKI